MTDLLFWGIVLAAPVLLTVRVLLERRAVRRLRRELDRRELEDLERMLREARVGTPRPPHLRVVRGGRA